MHSWTPVKTGGLPTIADFYLVTAIPNPEYDGCLEPFVTLLGFDSDWLSADDEDLEWCSIFCGEVLAWMPRPPCFEE